MGRAGGRWPATLCGTFLATALAGWPVLASGPAAAGRPVALTAAQARVLAPGAPTGLTATAGQNKVSLSWSPPASDGGAAISGYYVYQGTNAGGGSATPVNAGLIQKTTFTVSGLANGTTYYFTARAVNTARLSSGASNEASATPKAAATVPGAPAGLAASAGNAQISLSWTAPAATGAAKITGYRIYEGTSAAFAHTTAAASVTGTSTTVTGLVNGTIYYFRVTAVNDVGEGTPSRTASATPVTAPGAPAGLTATPGHGQVLLSWTAPASTGGATISGYVIYQGTSPGETSARPGGPVNGTSSAVTGLNNGTTYYFTVAAVNSAGQQGNASGEVSATPVAATSSASASASASPSRSAGPGAPGTREAPAPPSDLTATSGNAQVGLSWRASAGAASYRVYEGTSPTFRGTVPVASTPGTSATVSGLTNGSTYYFVVTAVSASGKTSASSGVASAEPVATAVLTAAKNVSKPVIISLAAVALGATAGAITLAVRRLRPRPLPPAAQVRALAEPGPPAPVTIEETGLEDLHTVRIELHPAAAVTTIKELVPQETGTGETGTGKTGS